MALLTPTELLDKGQAIVDLDAAGTQATATSNTFYNSGNEIIVCSNASAGVRTLTVTSAPDPFGRGGISAEDLAVAIPAGKIGMTSLLNPAMWNTAGVCTFTLDATATTKLVILRLRKLR